jgi:hypothetical protein
MPALALRGRALAKAIEDPKDGAQGRAPLFHRDRDVPYEKSLRMHRSCGLVIQNKATSLVTFLLLLSTRK